MARDDEPPDRRARFDQLLGEVLAGAGGGLATADPVGAAVGAGAPLAMRAFAWAAREFRERVLGHREARRVLTTLELAAARVEANLAEGRALREDGFFDPSDGGRSSAEEVVEGVLLAAQREHQEKKIPYYANLAANLAFEAAVDAVTADHLLRTAEELSYTQLGLLALVAKKGEHALPPDNRHAGRVPWRVATVRRELDDLGYARRELVGAVSNAPPGGRATNMGFPADLALSPTGEALHDLMRLGDVDDAELEVLAASLREYAGMGEEDDRPSDAEHTTAEP